MQIYFILLVAFS